MLLDKGGQLELEYDLSEKETEKSYNEKSSYSIYNDNPSDGYDENDLLDIEKIFKTLGL